MATAIAALVASAPTAAVPSGTPGEIAFRADKPGFPNIYLMNADGTSVVDLTKPEELERPGGVVAGRLEDRVHLAARRAQPDVCDERRRIQPAQHQQQPHQRRGAGLLA